MIPLKVVARTLNVPLIKSFSRYLDQFLFLSRMIYYTSKDPDFSKKHQTSTSWHHHMVLIFTPTASLDDLTTNGGSNVGIDQRKGKFLIFDHYFSNRHHAVRTDRFITKPRSAPPFGYATADEKNQKSVSRPSRPYCTNKVGSFFNFVTTK